MFQLKKNNQTYNDHESSINGRTELIYSLTSTKEVLFLPMSLYLLVCLTAGLHEKKH